MSALPRPIPTAFLLSDIEGSTQHVATAGPGYPALLAGVRRILREATSCHGGTEIDSHGDEFLAAFDAAASAVAAAVAAQRALVEADWGDGRDVRVRMGVHAGEAFVTEDGYTGLDIHRVARIASAGHGGQILISRSTTDGLSDATDTRPR